MSEVATSSAVWLSRHQQQVFRKLLNAVSYPGSIERIDSESVLLSVLACLGDRMTKVHDRDGLIAEADQRLLGAEFSALEEAQFVVVSGAVAPGKDWEPSLGTLTSPERGATILLTCESVESGDLSISLTGPGVPEELDHQVSGMDPAWLERREGWVSEFPKGVDLILVGRDGVMAWPRTTNIQVR